MVVVVPVRFRLASVTSEFGFCSLYAATTTPAVCGLFLIVGDDTYLDRSYKPFFEQAGKEISYATSPFQGRQGEYFSVIGNYVIRVLLPQQTISALDRIYRQTTGAHVLDMSALNRILYAKTKVRLEVQHNPKRSASLRRVFMQFFGKL